MLSFSESTFEAFAIVSLYKKKTSPSVEILHQTEEFSLVDITRDGGEETSKIFCLHKNKKNTGKIGKVNFFRNQN